MKKAIKILSVISAAAALCMPLAACGGGEEATVTVKSGLIGTFTYQETVGSRQGDLRIASDSEMLSGRSYILSTVFPRMDAGNGVAYGMDQRLKLNRDGTYKYDYSILITNPGDWGGQISRLSVSITGSFTYMPSGNDDGRFSVLLSDPTGGTQTVFGSHVTGNSAYGWAIHSNPDCIIDYEVAAATEGYKYDKYACSRVVAVDKKEKRLYDNIFYTDVLDHISAYNTY